MSLATTRTSLAASLTSAQPGVTIRPYRGRAVKSLDGWLVLRKVDRAQTTFREVSVTFDVLLPVGTDLVAAEQAIDARSTPLLMACEAVGSDVSLTPYEIPIDQATYFCIVCTFTTESEIA